MYDHSPHSDQSQPIAYLEPLRTVLAGCCILGNAAFAGLIWHQRFPGVTLVFANSPKLQMPPTLTETRYAIPAYAA